MTPDPSRAAIEALLAEVRAEGWTTREPQHLLRDLYSPDGLFSKLDAAVRALLDRVEQAERQRDEARTFGEHAAAEYNKLLELYHTVTCAFCGHEFPRGTPRHGDGALAEHIKMCQDHPLRAAEARATSAEAERDTLRAGLATYGEHKRGCASGWRASTGSSQIGPCDCGLAAVLTGEAPTPQVEQP